MQAESSQAAARRSALAGPGTGLRHSVATVRWMDDETLARATRHGHGRRLSLFTTTGHYRPRQVVAPRSSPTSGTPTTSSDDEDASGPEGEGEEEEDTDEEEKDESAMGMQLDKESWGWGLYLRLENAGSVARDHLALERTFLSYVRTSLALTSAGIALAQVMSIPSRSFDNGDDLGKRPPHYDHPKAVFGRRLAGMAIGLGLAILLIGVVRFFSVQWMLVHGRFSLSRHNIAGIVSAFSMLMLAVLSYIVIHG